jgi:hypothetical protein
MKKNHDNPSRTEKKSAVGAPPGPPAATEAAAVSRGAPPDAFLETVLGLRRQGLTERELAKNLVMKLLLRIDRLFGRIDEAFAGQPYLQRLPPDAPASQHRFNAYAGNCAQAAKLLGFAVELTRFISSTVGKPNDTRSE